MNVSNFLNSLFSDHKAFIFFIALVIELIVLYPLLAVFKWSLLGRIKMPLAERRLIFSNRKKNFDLEYFVDTYGDRNLRVIDGLSRKFLHIATGCWRLAILNLMIKDTQVSFKVDLWGDESNSGWRIGQKKYFHCSIFFSELVPIGATRGFCHSWLSWP